MTDVAFDLTRLLLNYAKLTPNGIDRVDITLAKHFVRRHGTVGTCLTRAQPALIDSADMARVVEALSRYWADGDAAMDGSAELETILTTVRKKGEKAEYAQHRSAVAPKNRHLRHRELAYLLAPSRLYRAVREELPRDSVFLHTFHCPFDSMMRWLAKRRDIKPVFVVHDLLALKFPEYFPPAHVEHERRWHDILAEYCGAAIVNSAAVKADLSDFFERRGSKTIPILVAPIPPDPVFFAEDLADEALQQGNYFVMCGTIEPRKNHLLMLQVWRELAERYGPSAPKLLILGRRGWQNENVVDLLERSHSLRDLVIEASGLPSRALARLMANARALLLPSFGEGYGLPIAEALATGTPVIAADIAVFREFENRGAMTLLHPLDGGGWLSAVMRHADGSITPSPERVRPAPESYFSRLDDFLAGL